MKTKQLRVMFIQNITPPNIVTLLLTDYEKGYNTGQYRFEKHLSKSAEGLTTHFRLIYSYNNPTTHNQCISFCGDTLSDALKMADNHFQHKTIQKYLGQRTYK